MCTDKTFCLSAMCTRRKKCRCSCQSWFSDPLILQRCEAECFGNPDLQNEGKDNFIASLCDGDYGAFEIYNKTGFICPDFDPLTDSEQGRKYMRDKKDAQTGGNGAKIMIVLGLVGLLGLLIFLSKK